MKMFAPSSLSRVLSALPLAAFLALATVPAQAQTVPGAATSPARPSVAVKDRYIVVFKKDVADPDAEAQRLMRGVANGRVHHVYSQAIKGFAATIPAQALDGIRRNPNVDYIEQDMTVQLNQTSPQNSATWGLDRIDQADRPLDTQYRFNATGLGVHAFIIDTGIRLDHSEFTGRVLTGIDYVGGGTSDCNGHGTHVAGTVGGTTWGVAKQVKLIPVRVLDCAGSGTTSGVIAGVNWVAGSTLRPAVANMSVGGGLSTSLNSAVAGAVAKGVTVVVAAGNSNANACNYSPASEPSAITVGATDSADLRASYSNYGSCVDLFAPGSNITSAYYTSASATAVLSGTSMASPHVAGVAALVLQQNPEAGPAAVTDFIKSNGTTNRLGSLGTGSPNLLLYALAAGAAPAPAPKNVAVASLTGSASAAKNGWTASVTVGVRDLGGTGGVANATVNASFTPGTTVSCVTGSTGSCVLRSATFGKTVTSTTLTVTKVSGTGLVYDATQNTATRVTIAKP